MPEGAGRTVTQGLTPEPLGDAQLNRHRHRVAEEALVRCVSISSVLRERSPASLLGGCPPPLSLQPGRLGCPARLRRLPFLPHCQSTSHDRTEPLGHILTVPKLAARSTGDQPKAAIAVQPGPESLHQLGPLLGCERGRAGDIPPDFDPGRAGVDMLATRATRAGGLVIEFRLGDGELRRDDEIVGHGER